jgi:hypothetical protein
VDNSRLRSPPAPLLSAAMKWLTRQEQTVLFTLLFLVFLGLAAKAYRTSTHLPQSNPPAATPR